MTRIPEWSTACLDWRERIIAGKSLIPFAPLFPAEASAAMEAFNALRIVDAPGSPVIGESSREWVQDFASAIFGAYDHETGRRLIREFFMLISKKNSKSTTAAGIMLTALLRNWRMSAEFLIVAPTLEVANNSYYPARDMVKADDELSDLLHVQDHLKTITHRGTGATLKVVAADNDTVSGKKATGVLIDELWLFGKRANAENMLREATGGLVSRPEGFVVYLSTQSDEPPSGIFRQKLNYYRDVRDGKIIDKRSLPVIYEFPEEMVSSKAYLETEHLHVTNPNIGLSVDREWLTDELAKAQNAGEESLRGFLAKHLNVEIGLALRSDRWPGADLWQAAADQSLTLDSLIARSEVAVVGIDVGSLDDLFGMAIVGRERGTGHWLAWTHAWCRRSVLTLRKAIAAHLQDFDKAGDLTIVDDLAQMNREMTAFVKRLEDAGLLPLKEAVGLDPYGAGTPIQALAEIKIDNDRLAAVSQGYRLAGAVLDVEHKLEAGELWHGGSKMMDWCVGNAKIEQKGNGFVVTKQAAGSAKIDPLMALFDAVSLMRNNPEARNRPTIFDYADLWGVA
jgi:phage terminase large subunit-like protein